MMTAELIVAVVPYTFVIVVAMLVSTFVGYLAGGHREQMRHKRQAWRCIGCGKLNGGDPNG